MSPLLIRDRADRRPARPQRARDRAALASSAATSSTGSSQRAPSVSRWSTTCSLGRRENLAGASRTRGGLARGRVRRCAVLDALLEIATAPFDLCFNLAVIPLPHSLEHPRENVDRNVAMTTAVCELSARRPPGTARPVLLLGGVRHRAHRSDGRETHPLRRAHALRGGEGGDRPGRASATRRRSACRLVIVRPFNTYGERQNASAYAGPDPSRRPAGARGRDDQSSTATASRRGT